MPVNVLVLINYIINCYSYNEKFKRLVNNTHDLPMKNTGNIHCMKSCALQLMHRFSGLLFSDTDDTLQTQSQFMALNCRENE